MSKAKSYFNIHAHHHPYSKEPSFYDSIITNIRDANSEESLMILDVGCGNGSFLKSLRSMGIKGAFVGTDISSNMLNIASNELSHSDNVDLFVADGFKLPIKPEVKFDLIHIDSVLHHLVEKNRTKSMDLAFLMLKFLTERLSRNGILVIEEMYYISHIIPSITSSFIFYGLKLLNLFHLNISRFRNEFQPGLEVNFFSDKQIEKSLSYHGTIKLLKKHPWPKIPLFYKFFLLKEAGHISYVLTGTYRGNLIE